ncbi:MAG: TrbI/VirB10 family protein [Sphingomonas bacterium]|nr:TrbI/VirB10 family protein [Sphingomonas bacterium]
MSVAIKTRDVTPGERDPRPIVAVPRRGVPGALIAAVGLAAALLLFLLLNNQRRSEPFTASGDDPELVAYAPPPPLSIPSETIPQTQYIPVVAARPFAPAPVAVAPVPAPTPAPVRERYEDPRPLPPPIYREPPPERPIRVPERGRAASGEPALVLDTSAEIPIGTLIPAVLETPIDTSRPGLARAIVARDARGLDGQRVLVPRGSRLIGEYQSDVRSGQNRVLVNWTRLIRPDGAAIRLGVPSADEMGAAGIPGQYHSFFLKRFFNAALQTALSVGGNLVGQSAGNTVVVGLPNSLGATAGQGLISNDIRPKITVKPGTLFNVFVAREIDLSGTTSGN